MVAPTNRIIFEPKLPTTQTMKIKTYKPILWILTCITLLGCSSESITSSLPTDNEQEVGMNTIKEATISLSVSPNAFTMDIESIDAKTRASQPLSDYFQQLDIAFFSTTNPEMVYRSSQNTSTDGQTFGNISMKLPIGSYKLVAIASKGTQPVQINSITEAIFPDNKPSDNASYCDDITLKQGNNTQTIELKRVVSVFRLLPTDKRPSNFKFIEATITGNCSNVLDPSTGLANTSAAQGVKRTIDISSYEPTPSSALAFYCFLGSKSEKVDVAISLKDGPEGNELKALSFKDVPLQPNYRTTYKGTLFSVNQDINLTLSDASWGNTTVEYDK